MIKNEEWRDVVGYEGIYQVSNLGNVRRVKVSRGSGRGENMKAAPSNAGYPRLSLCVNNKSKQKLVHVLVANAFLGPCPDGHEVNHKDGVKTNPRLDNLEYETSKGNTKHATVTGLMPFGTRRASAKLNDEKVRQIRQEYRDGKTQKEIARGYDVSRRTVGDVVNGRLWKHVI